MDPPRQEPKMMMVMMTTMEKTNYQLPLILLSITSLLFCFPGSTTCQVHPPPPAAPPPGLNLIVEQICQNTSYPSLCISTLTPFPAESMDSPTAILGMAVNATLNSTQAALAEATRLLSDPASPTTPDIASRIQQCQEDYGQAIKDLQTALRAMAEGKDLLFIGLLNGAKLAYETCGWEFTDKLYGYDFAYMTLLLDYFSPDNLIEMADNCIDIKNAIDQY